MLAAIQAWATQLGGVGLFLIAALDSSFLSFPQVNDVLVIYLSTRAPERMPYYAGMTTMGSLVGCLALFLAARKGGDLFLRRRFSPQRIATVLSLSQRFGLLAVIVPALLPPPTPFKLFVLMAGAAAVPTWKFCLAIIIGRGIRYFGEGYLAVRYGNGAMALVASHGSTVALALATLALIIGVVYTWRRRGSATKPVQR